VNTCEANIGLYLGGAVNVKDSLAGSWGCPDDAAVTLRGACVNEHVKEKRFCAAHGQVSPADGIWLCLACAEAGHDCPMTVTVVAA
jgi:hypothetical protein